MSDATARLAAALADRYVIERELGAGGMATVYLAHDVRHDRRVAVKVLRPELASILGAERFLSEIKTTANLQHPHILPLHDSGEADGLVFYVMPYVEGESLRERLTREKQLPVDAAVRIATEVASALDYAHRHGVVHRDIKPENILLHEGQALVADFGIALAASRTDGGSRLTETGMSLGTPAYMAPEQAMGEREITPTADVYALGCVLYEMLTGEPPFAGPTAQAIVARVMTDTPRSLTLQRHTVPPHVEAAVAKALEKLPADRFETAGQFADALSTPEARTAGRPEARASASGAGAPDWRRRFRVAAATAVVAVLAAAALWMLRGGSRPATPLHVELEPPPGTQFSAYQFAALSPDGRALAFVGLRPTGGRVLWLRDLQTGRTDSLAATDGAEAPFWSPDGRALGFFARGVLARINADGTAPQRLCATTTIGGSWSRQGVILFTRGGHPMTVSAGGGPCTPVGGAWADSSLVILRPAWLPDGRHFAGQVATMGVEVSSVAGEKPRPFIANANDVRFVAPDLAVFTHLGPRGADVVAQHFDARRLALTGIPSTLAQDIRTAGQVPSVTVSATALAYLPAARPDVGPLVANADGAIVDSVSQGNTWTFRLARAHPLVALAGEGLWEYDLARRTSVPIAPSGIYAMPVWGPGDSLIAVAQLSPCAVVVVRLATGSDTTLIHRPGQQMCFFPSDWTADGNLLVLTSYSYPLGGGGAIWTYALKTGALTRVLSVDGSASAGVVSPDQRWLAYVSDETGALQVYVRPFGGSGATVRVSLEGGALPRWRRDGRALYFEAPDGRVLTATVAAGPRLEVGTPHMVFRAPRWSLRLFADQWGGVQAATTYDVSADGTRFLLRQRIEATEAATLITNWQGLLGRSATSEGGPSGD